LPLTKSMRWMLNGDQVEPAGAAAGTAGGFGSVNVSEPVSVTSWKLLLNTSIFSWAKFAA